MVDHIYFQCTSPAYWYAGGMLSSLERVRFDITRAMMMLRLVPRTDVVIYMDVFVAGCIKIGARTVLSVGPPVPHWLRTYTRWEGTSMTQIAIDHDHCLAATRELLQSWGDRENCINMTTGSLRVSAPLPYDHYIRDQDSELAKKVGHRYPIAGQRVQDPCSQPCIWPGNRVCACSFSRRACEGRAVASLRRHIRPRSQDA